MRWLAVLGAILLAAVACSDRVPLPPTPIPSPQLGYPPAPATALPEGLLLVQKGSGLTSQAPLFAIDQEGEVHPLDWTAVISRSPDGSRAVLARQEKAGGPYTSFAVTTEPEPPWVQPFDWSVELPFPPFFVWSPGGERLAYAQPAEAAPDRSFVWTVDLDTGEKRLLTQDSCYCSPLSWTDSEELVVQASDRVMMVGAERREYPLPQPSPVLEVSVSPDGRRAAMVLGDFDAESVSHATGFWLLDLGTGEWTRLADLGGAEWRVWIGASMSWSPDNRRIAYYDTYSDEDGLIRSGLSVMDTRTGESRRVHGEGGWPHSWAPDGKYLAYSYEAQSRADRFGVMGVMGTDGNSREKRITVRGTAWSPAGALLVKTPGGVSLVDPVTLKDTDIPTDAGAGGLPGPDSWVWSPSGRYFAAATHGDQYYRASIYIMDTKDGTASVYLERAGFAPLAWLRE